MTPAHEPSARTATMLGRRRFLASAAAGAGGAIALGALDGLSARAAHAAAGAKGRAGRGSGGYGRLVAKRPAAVGSGADPTIAWLALPEGFEYAVFGLSGSQMSDGNPTPNALDGMGCFGMPDGSLRLVRNHENRDSAANTPGPIAGPANAYNPQGAGGTTTLRIGFDAGGLPVLEDDFVSLNGTIVNCAGGVTPRGSWISSEETVETRGGIPHGYNFEVPAAALGPVAPVPLRAMGRFSHEAVAVDPATGVVYETEDAGDSGFYRFLPHDRDDLAVGGRLQMLKVAGATNYDTRTGQRVGRSLPVEWVEIDDPDPASGELKAVYDQGVAQGAAVFRRLEGCWFGNGAVYFVATDGGEAGEGQVWEFRPAGDAGYLTLVYESPGEKLLSFPDNLTVSPRGGLLLCEDTHLDDQYLRGLTRDGRVLDFGLNLRDDKEWAGACYSPDGRHLFVNTQGETRTVPDGVVGRTYAIWGPWEDGAL